jgi:hypothetical protein
VLNFLLSLFLFRFSPTLIRLKKKQAAESTDEPYVRSGSLHESQVSIVTTASSSLADSTLPSSSTSQLPEPSPPTLADHFRDFCANARLILSNRIYMLIVTCTICETFLIKGFSSYLTKYLEYQYRLPASTATMIAGGIGFISLVFGTLSGAFLVKRFNWTIKHCCKFVTVNLFFTSILFLGLTIYCPQERYINGQSAVYQSSACACDSNTFYPLCYNNEYIFQTPCHAGCTSFDNSATTYSNCRVLTALLQNNASSSGGTTTLSPCSRPDKNCIGHLVIVSFAGLGILFLSSIVLLPLLRIILESIGPDNQSFALGIRSLLTKLFGNIPGPIVFASVVDRSCVQWTQRAFTGSKTCRLYDNRLFSLGLSLLGSGVRFLSGCFALVTLIFVLKMHKLEITDPESSDDKNADDSVATQQNTADKIADDIPGKVNFSFENDEMSRFKVS